MQSDVGSFSVLLPISIIIMTSLLFVVNNKFCYWQHILQLVKVERRELMRDAIFIDSILFTSNLHECAAVNSGCE